PTARASPRRSVRWCRNIGCSEATRFRIRFTAKRCRTAAGLCGEFVEPAHDRFVRGAASTRQTESNRAGRGCFSSQDAAYDLTISSTEKHEARTSQCRLDDLSVQLSMAAIHARPLSLRSCDALRFLTTADLVR